MMAERYTQKDLEEIADSVNRSLYGKYKVVPSYRYGYVALDLFDAETGSMKSTLRSGMTKGETAEYMYAMLKGIELEESAKKSKLNKVI